MMLIRRLDAEKAMYRVLVDDTRTMEKLLPVRSFGQSHATRFRLLSPHTPPADQLTEAARTSQETD